MFLSTERLFCFCSILLPFVFVSTAFISHSSAAASKVVAPPGLEDNPGNGFGSAPTGPFRAQYLYPAAHFDSIDKPSDMISLAWRLDEGSGRVSSTSDSVIIRLSTTEVDELDKEFARNLGSNETLVFDGPISFSSTGRQVPQSFDIAAQFSTPFQFDPSLGNLLVDVTFSGFDVGWRADNQEILDGLPRLITYSSGRDSNPDFAGRAWDILAVMEFGFTSDFLIGDLNRDGMITITDLDVMVLGNPDHDLNRDGMTDFADLDMLVHETMNTWFGDANGDGQFNSTDLVQVFEAGLFDTNEDAIWSQGDWSLDGRFDTKDFVLAFQDGGYEQGTRPKLTSVPEQSTGVAILFGFCAIGSRRRFT